MAEERTVRPQVPYVALPHEHGGAQKSRPGDEVPGLSIYGLMAEFESTDSLIRGIGQVREAGYKKMDAYTPYPSHEVSHALGQRGTRLPLIVLIGGITGLLLGFFMQYYTAVIDYPLNIGGRPMNSWPAFLPVTFEMTILLASFAAVFGMLALNGLPMPYHPVFNVPRFGAATRDKFFLVVEASDPRFDYEETRRLLATLTPNEVLDVPH